MNTNEQTTSSTAKPLAPAHGSVESLGKTQAWFRLRDNPAPNGIAVLMWFEPTNGQPPWATVDRIENRVLVLPDFWAPIFPPNAEVSEPGGPARPHRK